MWWWHKLGRTPPPDWMVTTNPHLLLGQCTPSRRSGAHALSLAIVPATGLHGARGQWCAANIILARWFASLYQRSMHTGGVR